MFGQVLFYIHGAVIEYDGVLFSAGELTTDLLKISPEKYHMLTGTIEQVKSLDSEHEHSSYTGGHSRKTV